MGDASGGYSAARRLRAGGRDDVRAALLAERERTLAAAAAYEAALGPQMAVPPDPGLNPPRWELGHVAWFQGWWIGRNPQCHRGAAADPDTERAPDILLPQADTWFDSDRVPHATRWSLALPDLATVRGWLAATLEATLARLDALPPDAGDDALYFFRLACLHEAMHVEAAGYMARTLGFSVVPPQGPLGAAAPLRVPAQRMVLGSGPHGFAFDNELGAHAVDLPAFEIDAQPLSWARFADFADDGGYQDRRWWSEAGWLWIGKERHASPRFPRGHGPAVHLSAHEAEAWCRWAGRRLPSEAEWECAAITQPDFRWGQVWEWTATDFGPYPGFQPHPYRRYSQPWFGSHRVLRGACAATSPHLAHPRYRNFFEPHRSDVFAGFRSCAADGGAHRF